ncbi:MAG: hypothetical protein AB9866_13830 [Syntrophobacteraceae bacterium]
MAEADWNRIADFIRAKSQAGELIGSVDLQAEIPGIVASGELEPFQNPQSIQDAMLNHDDIETLLDDAGNCFYYSERFMAGAYASMLVLRREGSVRMMAEVIRENSRAYPRPVPVALFRSHPFNLDEDQIETGLKEMTQKSLYRDIALITTSIGNGFAYSTDYLSQDYAVMLAEWVDVGQAENP